MIMTLMALVCLTVSAKQDKGQQPGCDSAQCCQKCPIPGMDKLSDEDKAKLKEIMERYMADVKAVCPEKKGECEKPQCEKPQGDMGPQGPRPMPGDTAMARPEGPRPEGDARPEGPDRKGGPQECCQGPQLTDEEADALMETELKAKADIIAIQQKYYSEFRTVLSPQQVKALYSAQCDKKKGGQQPRGGQRHGGPGQPGQPGQPGGPGEPAPAQSAE